MLHEFAPAKINLYLHITGRRADGYHNLDSLTAFAGIGDEIKLEPAEAFSFALEGPQARALAQEAVADNLVVRAAQSLAELTGRPLKVKITLVKNLPVASGIGGGSSDAAAALRALAHHWGLDAEDPRIREAAARHGQDVPVCLTAENCTITAEGVEPAGPLPLCHIVLVNPGQGLPTAGVYKAYKETSLSFSREARLEKAPATPQELAAMLKTRRNDLTKHAIRLLPEIATILKEIEASPGCLLARMSGSGATCFGLYADRSAARRAAAEILAKSPNWWVTASYMPCLQDQRKA